MMNYKTYVCLFFFPLQKQHIGEVIFRKALAKEKHKVTEDSNKKPPQFHLPFPNFLVL